MQVASEPPKAALEFLPYRPGGPTWSAPKEPTLEFLHFYAVFLRCCGR